MRRGASLAQRVAESPEWAFLVLFLIGSMFCALVTPVGAAFDEPSHIGRVEQIAAGDILPQRLPEEYLGQTFANPHRRDYDSYGGLESQHVLYIVFGNTSKFLGTSDPYTPEELSQLGGSAPYGEGQRIPFLFSNSSVNNPAVYFPQLLGFLVGRALGSVRSVVLGMRFGGIAFFALGMFLLIRNAPMGKWVLFYFGLVPANVVASSTVTADTITILCCTAFLAALLWTVFADDRRRSTLALLCTCTIILGLLKVTSILLLLLLLLLVPGRAARPKRDRMLIAASVLLCLVLFALWMRAVSGINTGVMYKEGVDPKAQMAWIIAHPLNFLWLNVKNFVDIASFDFGDLIHLSARAGSGDKFFCVIGLFLMLSAEAVACRGIASSHRREATWLAIASLVLFILYFGMTNTALYLQYTDVGEGTIRGVQPRYFLPVLTMVLYPILLLVSRTLPGGGARSASGNEGELAPEDEGHVTERAYDMGSGASLAIVGMVLVAVGMVENGLVILAAIF
jgi:hypothetical protein